MEPAIKPESPAKGPSKILTQYYGALVLFMLTFFLVVAFGFLRPMIEEIKQVNAESKSIAQATENERAYLASLDASIGAAQSIPAYVLKQVTEALPSEVDTPSLLVQLDAAAARNTIRIENVNFTENKVPAASNAAARAQTTQVTPLDISLSLSAKNYFDVKRFLADIESSLRLMDIVGLSTGGVSADGREFKFSAQIKTYAFGQVTKATTR